MTESESIKIDPAQQWEQLASPGHVLLARADAVAGKNKLGRFLLLVGTLLIIAGALAGSYVHVVLQRAATWISSVSISSSSEVFQSRFLEFGQLPADISQTAIAALTSESDVHAWVSASIKRLDAGKQPEFCNYIPKITDSILQGDGSAPSCRKGADGRVWIWAVMRRGGDTPSAFGGVFRKVGGMYTFYRFQGVPEFGNTPSIMLGNIPRAVAADLPELVAGVQK